MKIVGFEANNDCGSAWSRATASSICRRWTQTCPPISAKSCAAAMAISKPLAELAKKAPASARRPLAGLKYALPVARPGKIICLGLNYLDHVKEGPQRDNIPKFQSIFFRMLTSLTPHCSR